MPPADSKPQRHPPLKRPNEARDTGARPARRRRRRRFVLLAIVLAYVGFMTFGGCADKFLLHPPQGAIDAGRATRREFQSDGRTVEIWTARSPKLAAGEQPRAYVLEYCGNGTRAEQIAQYVADRWKN